MPLPSISDAQRHFSVGSRMRGERYFRQKRVRLERLDQDAVRAVVRGTSSYDVEIDSEEGGLGFSATCTCPAYFETGACKHIWAAFLAAHVADALAYPQLSGGAGQSAASCGPPRPDPEDWRRPLGELRALASATGVESGPRVRRRLCFVLWARAEVLPKSVTLEVLAQRSYKRGGWSEPRPFVQRSTSDVEGLSEADLACLSMVHGGHDAMWSYGRGSRYEIPPVLQPILLPRVARESRLALGFFGQPRLTPLASDAGGCWSFGIAIGRGDPPGQTTAEGILVRGIEQVRLVEAALLLPGGLFVGGDRLHEVDWHGAWEVARILRRSGRIEMPSARESELLAILCRLPGEPRVDAPGIVRDIQEPPGPLLLLSEPDWLAGRRAQVPGRVAFQYGPFRVGTGDDCGLRPGGEALVRIARDRAAERAARERLAALGGRLGQPDDRSGDFAIPARDLPELVRVLSAEGWRIEADGRLFRSAGSLHLSVRSGIDWFDLEGAAVFGEASAALPEILRAVRSGTRLVRLSDGGFGVLPEAWLAGWGLAALATVRDGRALRFQANQAWLLDALLSERQAPDVDSAFERARAALRGASDPRPAAPPRSFRGKLRAYQREGLGWLRWLSGLGLGGCLADEMGLGKTVQVLAFLCDPSARGRPALVVAPRSVAFNWISEAERFAPRLSVLAHHGPDRSRDEGEIAGHDLVVTTYGTLRRDAELLARIRFGHAILDEAQAIKNPESRSAKAARLLAADQRLVLTGTPVENHLDDLWSLFEFLNPGMLGRSRVFQAMVGSQDGERSDPGPLARALRPFLLRRTKEQVLGELPPKVEQIIACDLEGAERQQYEELRDHYRRALLARADAQGLERIQIHVLEALLRLRQAACHPGLLDRARASESSAKLEALLPMLAEIRESGHKALVFSQFTTFLAILRGRLDALACPYEYLDGRTRKREERILRFQGDSNCTIFLISLKAGGFGLNLTAADYVFLLDPWWNPAVERQAVDRAHRIGQTRPVNAYRLVARGTIEEKVLELQERKRALANAILGEADGSLRDLTREDLERLLT